MTKYKVPQAAMDELNEYKDGNYNYLNIYTLLSEIPQGSELGQWIWRDKDDTPREQAVIDYVFNGADNFEVKTPAWVIVSKQRYRGFGWLALDQTRPNKDEEPKLWMDFHSANRQHAIDNGTRITDPHIKDMLLELNKDFEAIEVEE
ncbi:hypothetical protein [Weissella koreensis]|uniref:hypothetical protein n=1 Tax=Weissella koreensis TaxID=165096 RepID=UPI000CF31ADB|nr:hypothetical protein [Weissella koreensis]AVH74730.1 hypothetical protein C4597_01275 [Weissella koreensis]QGN19952.1 hypothetical protein GKC51_01245 [Weissella koreensis]